MDADASAGRPRVDCPRFTRALEERRLERPPRLGKDHLVAEAREQAEELLHVAPLVEEIGAEDEIPRGRVDERRGCAPCGDGRLELGAVPLGVSRRDLDGVGRPIGREHVRAPESRDDARQAEATAELEHSEPVDVEAHDLPSERDRRRPQLCPIGQELLVLERFFVEQGVGDARPKQRDPPPTDADDLLDQVEDGRGARPGTRSVPDFRPP
jgi:hypothetical protein